MGEYKIGKFQSEAEFHSGDTEMVRALVWLSKSIPHSVSTRKNSPNMGHYTTFFRGLIKWVINYIITVFSNDRNIFDIHTFRDFCPLPSIDHWAIQDNDYCTVHMNCHRTKKFSSLIYLKYKMAGLLLFRILKKPVTFMRSTNTQRSYKRYNIPGRSLMFMKTICSKITGWRLKYVIRTRTDKIQT